MNRSKIFHLSIFTLVGFPLIAYIIMHFNSEASFVKMFSIEYFNTKAILIGLSFGIVTALLGLVLVNLLPESKLSSQIQKFIDLLNPNWYHILFYSFCAGFGEEILFRGAIQSFIGIWPTAILFVAVHGYLNYKDMPMFVYGFFLVIVSAGFGYLMEFGGIYASIFAHFIYDVIVFFYLKRKKYTEL